MSYHQAITKKMKASALKLLFLSASFIGLSGCGNDDGAGDSEGTPEIAGSYELVSMRSNISVDLNNDDILSKDMLSEIGEGTPSSSQQSDLEIKPVFVDNKLVQLMSFYLPHPTLTFEDPKKPEGTVKYTSKGLGYQYQYDNNTNDITVDLPQNQGTVPSSGQLETITVIESNELEATFEKYYYDFSINNWRLLTITCRYNRE